MMENQDLFDEDCIVIERNSLMDILFGFGIGIIAAAIGIGICLWLYVTYAFQRGW